MTKTAIVKGIVRWYGKNVLPHIPAFSVAKAFHAAAVIMAESNPSVAESLILNAVSPQIGAALQSLVGAASDNALFDLAMKSLREAVDKEPIVLPAPGTNGLNVRGTDIDLLAGEIRNAQTELDNASALAGKGGV